MLDVNNVNVYQHIPKRDSKMKNFETSMIFLS